ncbi:MAG: hypothetical protein ACXVBW_12700, partial [Bdellovibrionota bacterium]
AVFVYIVFHTWIAASQSIQDTQADLIASRSPVEKVSDHFSIDADGRELPTQKQQDAWADLANLNVRMGGPVWPVLMRYYSAP